MMPSLAFTITSAASLNKVSLSEIYIKIDATIFSTDSGSKYAVSYAL
jgi:hypothetical protein